MIFRMTMQLQVDILLLILSSKNFKYRIKQFCAKQNAFKVRQNLYYLIESIVILVARGCHKIKVRHSILNI